MAILVHIPTNSVRGLGVFLMNLWSDLLCEFLTFFPINREEVYFSSISSPAFIVVDFLMLTILTYVRQYHIVFLIYSSLILTGAEHLFMCFLATSMSSLEKCPFKSCVPVWLGCFFDIEAHKLFVCFQTHMINSSCVSLFANISCILRVVFLFCLWFPLLLQCF